MGSVGDAEDGCWYARSRAGTGEAVSAVGAAGAEGGAAAGRAARGRIGAAAPVGRGAEDEEEEGPEAARVVQAARILMTARWSERVLGAGLRARAGSCTS
jgi:hypothetical protein